MIDQPLVVIPVLFGLSLLAAVLLFKFFKSSALIKTKEYRAGGAIGGFIIVFLMLFYSYSQLGGYQRTISAQRERIKKRDQRIESLNRTVGQLQAQLKPLTIVGSVAGPLRRNQDVHLVLGIESTLLNEDGSFRLKVPSVELHEAQLTVYLVNEGKFKRFEVMPGDDLSHWRIPRISPQ